MGCVSSCVRAFRRDRAPFARVPIAGLDGAGKTVILYKLKFGLNSELPTHPISTIGCNVETVLYNDKELVLWDLGGHEKIRPLWRKFTFFTVGIIYVIDSTDRERFEETKEHLYRLLEHPKPGTPLLVLANKQDLPGALTPEEISDRLDLDNLQISSYEHGNLLDSRKWKVQGCSAIKNGKGLTEGMEWLSEEISVPFHLRPSVRRCFEFLFPVREDFSY
eukprot:Phypoly_transcript_15223.p1 GENE.Phypoly_transcript_15223~~Phypoly_transcript_15223.p1  ORF type:complete len:220 (+),score=9.08 Phypoly_transcript_15223:274-933(+)